MLPNQRRPVLTVEDDSIDQQVLKRLMARYGIPNPVCIAVDGQEALQAVRDGAPGIDGPPPQTHSCC